MGRDGEVYGGGGVPESGSLLGQLGADVPAASAVPAHVRPTLEAEVRAQPSAATVALAPRPDPRARRWVWERSITLDDLRLRGPEDELRLARATERLLDAFSEHLERDLGEPETLAEAMVRSVGFLLWFSRHFASASPLALDADLVRTCFGNYYIRRHHGPELRWIWFGVRGAAALAAFLHRLEWSDWLDLRGLLALPDDADWFRDRLESYWEADGDTLAEWSAEYDFERL